VSITLTAATTQVRQLLDETSAQFWTTAMIQNWLNQACKEIARQTETLWMQTTFASIPTPPTANYAAPTDMLGVHKLTFLIKTGGISSQQWYNLEFQGIKQMDEIWGILHNLPAAFPNSFYLWNKPTITSTHPPVTAWYFGIYPVPGTTGTFTLYYYRDARTATSGSTKLDVIQGYETLPQWYAVAMAKYRDRDSTWQTAMQWFNTLVTTMKDNTSRFTDESNHFTADGNAQGPIYLYSAMDGGGW
jgi:hypothetical protein